ncbi:hypothetical protein OGX97_07765 [Citrobacter sp. Cpo061]|uniref:hypothetical protein n=1 Tax=Citrobacter TaxID=544 RepID=UPI00244AE4F5|nr:MULTISPECIES: hypothetical protein [Citrobacter]MDH1795883.1 hypothetical protein [Citrobacter portucalensis]MDM2867109.1 hypothetical protein [Citrobacter sp. Cpo061]
MATPTKAVERVEAEKKRRLAAGKRQLADQVKLMRALGILPNGATPKTKHFNMLAAHHNGVAAANRAISIQRDLAAFEQAGGIGAAIMATLNNPKAKATERAYALQAMIQLTKAAPQVVAATPVTTDDDTSFLIDDNELAAIEREFSGG